MMPLGRMTRLDAKVFSVALSQAVRSSVLTVGVGTYALSTPGHGCAAILDNRTECCIHNLVPAM